MNAKKHRSIPPHINCVNCGKCCGCIPVDLREYEQIVDYLKDHKEVLKKVCESQQNPEICPFRDEESRCCLIYEIRPLICRLMGVCDLLPCKQGNSASIDPFPYMQGRDLATTVILNDCDWSAIDKTAMDH